MSRKLSEPCRHEPTLTITKGAELLDTIICTCRKCGQLHEFPVSMLAGAVSLPPDKPHLRLVTESPDDCGWAR